jgi:DNA-3-methyladenine glycosylase I
MDRAAPSPEVALPAFDPGLPRCAWAGADGPKPDPLMVVYHDEDWGVPVSDDGELFERLALESFQAGLSWSTILRKREAFRAAFRGFDPALVAAFGPDDRERLLADAGIVRNRQKIDATINNAHAVVEADVDFAELVWSFAPKRRPRPRTPADIPNLTPESTALAKELKRRGFRFVGPTTAYAMMQACGLVDDHIDGCLVKAGRGSASS